MSLSALQYFGSIVAAAVAFYTTVTLKLKSLKAQIDGVGKKERDAAAQNQRRWLHEIADRVEELEPPERADRLAHRIREEAWRS